MYQRPALRVGQSDGAGTCVKRAAAYNCENAFGDGRPAKLAVRRPGVERLSRDSSTACFVNTDPPGLVDVWNTSFTARGAAALRTAALLEYFLFAKPYFDPEGLIVAAVDDKIIGFALAGFGPADDGAHLDPALGVVCRCSASSRPTASRAVGSETGRPRPGITSAVTALARSTPGRWRR